MVASACFRRTGQPFFATTFPVLLEGKTAPEQPSVWESSRFALDVPPSAEGRWRNCCRHLRALRRHDRVRPVALSQPNCHRHRSAHEAHPSPCWLAACADRRTAHNRHHPCRGPDISTYPPRGCRPLGGTAVFMSRYCGRRWFARPRDVWSLSPCSWRAWGREAFRRHHLDHARSVIARWVAGYNEGRQHLALGYLTPAAYAATQTATDARLRPDQLRRSPFATAQTRNFQPRTLESAR